MPLFRPGLRALPGGLLLGLAIAWLPATASAQETADTQRIYQLRDGSQVAGQLVELLPGERVVLILADGRVRTIAWAELGSEDKSRPSAQLMPVTIQADHPVEIFEQLGEGQEKKVLSTTTADPSGPAAPMWLPKAGEFRVGGPGVTSEKFQLPLAGAVKLHIAPGRRSRSIAGIALLASGSVVAGSGLALLLGAGIRNLGAGSQDTAVGPPGWLPLSKQLLFSAGVVLPIGIIGLIAGSASYILSKTRVEVSPSYSAAVPLASGLQLSARGVEF